MTDTGRYQIRALERALAILTALNQHNGLNASELSRLVGLPRPTVLRLLLTLGESGYVVRSEADNSFRAARKVRELSSGYRPETSWREIAENLLRELSEELVWALAITRMEGDLLTAESLTDHHSQTMLVRHSAGRDLPLLYSSSGYLFLARAGEERRQKLVEKSLTTDKEILETAKITEDFVWQMIQETQEQGYATLHLPTHSSISVPVMIGDKMIAGMNLRMHAHLAARQERIRSFLPQLHDGARELGERIAASGLELSPNSLW